mmetsp:Transcript_3384/g.4209  ORF Transcript_3384/g.4209 Transcript_3384/m.4209 type:complete len:94 (+) Transcript_3384:208-489(+)
MEGTEFLRRARERGAVLVHCAAGISRSASLVIAYLIRYHRMDFEEAFEHVKLGRNFINPNKSFIEQLRKLAAQYRTKNSLFARFQGYLQTANK